MITLGVSVRQDMCAMALVNDQGVRAVHKGAVDGLDGGIPWDTLSTLMRDANVLPSDVATVAISGRFTPFLLRRYPHLRDALRPKATSPLFAIAARAYETMGWSGLATVDEDRVAVWYQGLFQSRGFANVTVRMVHTNHALVSAAYVYQQANDAQVLVAHPRGDGPSVQAYSVQAGQIQSKGWPGSQLKSLRSWFDRAVSLCGFEPRSTMDAFWAEVESGTPDPELVSQFQRDILERSRSVSRKQWSEVATSTACASVAEAIAVVLANVVDALDGNNRTVVVGRLVDAPLMRGLLCQKTTSVCFSPWTTGMDLAIGAAAYLAGTHPSQDWFAGHRDTTESVMPLVREYGVFFAGEYAVQRLIRDTEVPASIDRNTVLVRAQDAGALDASTIRTTARDIQKLPDHISGTITLRCVSDLRDGANAAMMRALLREHVNHVLLETRPFEGPITKEKAREWTAREGLQGMIVSGLWETTNGA